MHVIYTKELAVIMLCRAVSLFNLGVGGSRRIVRKIIYQLDLVREIV